MKKRITVSVAAVEGPEVAVADCLLNSEFRPFLGAKERATWANVTIVMIEICLRIEFTVLVFKIYTVRLWHDLTLINSPL